MEVHTEFHQGLEPMESVWGYTRLRLDLSSVGCNKYVTRHLTATIYSCHSITTVY
jgi:hypothetical protein